MSTEPWSSPMKERAEDLRQQGHPAERDATDDAEDGPDREAHQGLFEGHHDLLAE